MQNQKKNESTYLKDAKPEDLRNMKSRLQKQRSERKAVADIDEVVRMVQKRGQREDCNRLWCPGCRRWVPIDSMSILQDGNRVICVCNRCLEMYFGGFSIESRCK